MKTAQFFGCLVLLMSSVALVRADIAKPKTTPQENKSLYTSIEVIPDAKATDARLQIRQSTLNDLRAALNGDCVEVARTFFHCGDCSKPEML